MKKILLFIVAVCFTLFMACRDNTPDPPDQTDLTHIPYEPKPYTIIKPAYFPEVPVPADNPMTYDGIQLGRRLFYDPILSGDSTMSCSSCHLANMSFADGKKVSTGIDNISGRRSSMSLINVAYSTAFFWDGRSPTLEDQATRPVEDPIELHTTWDNVVEKLKVHPTYPSYFRKAFGISNTKEITKELAAKAIAQFERIIISSGNSVYDRYKNDQATLEGDAFLGKLMFNDEGADLGLPDAECFHCHNGYTINGGNFFNNGIDPFTNMPDIGLAAVTGVGRDSGKFKTPTLRNIEFTAPYMHDGRFQTLEQVVDHYFSGGHPAPNQDPAMARLRLNKSKFMPEHRIAIIEFLKTLTDTTLINNPDLQNPF